MRCSVGFAAVREDLAEPGVPPGMAGVGT